MFPLTIRRHGRKGEQKQKYGGDRWFISIVTSSGRRGAALRFTFTRAIPFHRARNVT